jgi:hypothetical protein
MADSFQLNGKAREILAGKIKEQIVVWLRGKKRGSDTASGGDSKRQKLDSQVKTSTKLGKASGSGTKIRTGRA